MAGIHEMVGGCGWFQFLFLNFSLYRYFEGKLNPGNKFNNMTT